MKKIVLGMTAALVTASLLGGSASADSRSTRRASDEYGPPPAVRAGEFWVGVFGDGIDGWSPFDVKRGEDHVSLRVVDESGRKVAGAIYQGGRRLAEFCGSAEDVRLRKGRNIEVLVWTGHCADGTPSTPMGGTIKAVFSDRL